MITYCSNIHPGESWEEIFGNLRRHVPAVKAAVSPDHPFPIGLRLPALAASQLTPDARHRFGEWLQEQECFIPTINGFPFGSFHGVTIKEQVYQPDWRSAERAAYTVLLADLLSEWLPPGVTGSISTVPLGFKGMLGREQMPQVRRQLISVLTHLERNRQQQGREIILALEPEPGCLLETTQEVCQFFSQLKLPRPLEELIGICYDCCHQAVEFEDPARSLALLQQAGVRVAKVQASSAPCWVEPDPTQVLRFDEATYLHQVLVRRRDGRLKQYRDLPEAVAGHHAEPGDQWRCHFHIPIFLQETPVCGTTQQFLLELLALLPDQLLVEVETYTWQVLPRVLQKGAIGDAIIRELLWLKERRHAASGGH